MSRATQFRVGLAGAVAIFASAGVAFAASSYTINASAPKTVAKNHSFKVKASGFSKSKSYLEFFLARDKCMSDYTKESGAATGAYKKGDPTFKLPTKLGPMASTIYTVKGHFKQTAAAQAGKNTGKYFVCAYLYTLGKKGTSTRAHDSAGFKVTP